ncbi:MAG: hypothetical protein ACTHQM_25610 [Thermoanaerobaculia bacterium]
MSEVPTAIADAAERRAQLHHKGIEIATFEQVAEIAKKQVSSILESVRPSIAVSPHIKPLIELYLRRYRQRRDFLRNQTRLF